MSLEYFNFRGQLLDMLKHHKKEVAYLCKKLKAMDIHLMFLRKNERVLKSEASNLQKKLTDAKAKLDKALEKH